MLWFKQKKLHKDILKVLSNAKKKKLPPLIQGRVGVG